METGNETETVLAIHTNEITGTVIGIATEESVIGLVLLDVTIETAKVLDVIVRALMIGVQDVTQEMIWRQCASETETAEVQLVLLHAEAEGIMKMEGMTDTSNRLSVSGECKLTGNLT